ncbi:MAG: metal-dependent transcriptional regulator [Eubacteriales bacterium]|nr:metal-dependent transcriptional regulator [Eubacteriales bacterium]
MKIGKSGEDYLEAILVLSQKNGSVRSVDVANYMNFSKPSVSHAMKELRRKGYLEVAENGCLELTQEGQSLAERVYERHRFFVNQLLDAGVSQEVAERDACEIEHIISEESFQKLKKNYEKSI